MRAPKLQPDSSPITVSAIAKQTRYWILIARRYEIRDAPALAGTALKGKIRRQPVSRQKIEPKIREAAVDIVSILTEENAPIEFRVGERRQIVEVCNIAIVH